MESLIIKALAPSANRADQIQTSARTGNGMLLKPTKVAPRRRPFPRFRAVAGRAVSIWKVPHFLDLAQRDLDQPTAAPEMEDCRHVRASFSQLYWENQRHVLIGKAEHGPISIFTPGYLVLFLAYTATAKPFVSLPTSWDRPTRARFLYEAGEALEHGVMPNSKRYLASRTIGNLLRQNQLPPLQLPPLMVNQCFGGASA